MTKLKNLEKIYFPREKLTKYGPEKLKDYELLAILLGSGTKGKNVLILSKELLKRFESIGLEKISLEDVQKIKGVGLAKATQIISLIELSKRMSHAKPEILTPKDVWRICADIRESKKEHLVALYLDTQARLINKQIISIGILDRNLIHPREIFEPAITLHASSLIIVHNHPSGILEPSKDDLLITEQMISAGIILGIDLEDHIIITIEGYRSLREAGLMKKVQ
jgi:DNA repair protein RadC